MTLLDAVSTLVEDLEARRNAVVLEHGEPTAKEGCCFPPDVGHAWLCEADLAALTYDEPSEPKLVSFGDAVIVTMGCIRCGTERKETYRDGQLEKAVLAPFAWIEKVRTLRDQYISHLDAATCVEAEVEFGSRRPDTSIEDYTLTELHEDLDAIGEVTLSYWRRLGVKLDVPYYRARQSGLSDMRITELDPQVYLDYPFS